MTLFAIIVAVVLAFLAFKFVKGLIKFGLLAVLLILALWFASGGLHGMAVR
jgi:hypothetical protein